MCKYVVVYNLLCVRVDICFTESETGAVIDATDMYASPVFPMRKTDEIVCASLQRSSISSVKPIVGELSGSHFGTF